GVLPLIFVTSQLLWSKTLWSTSHKAIHLDPVTLFRMVLILDHPIPLQPINPKLILSEAEVLKPDFPEIKICGNTEIPPKTNPEFCKNFLLLLLSIV
ncbi:MAG TPA: hypothetical protein PKD85_22700, partial [Saprospiraceae bacterium]|nr:hypothetical protein [Saprospiraceae bacterium]